MSANEVIVVGCQWGDEGKGRFTDLLNGSAPYGWLVNKACGNYT